MSERASRPRRHLLAMLAAVLPAACAGIGSPAGSPPQQAPVADDRVAAVRVLDWYHGLRDADAAELARSRRQYADKAASAEIQLRQALLAAHPQAPNLARARSLLETVLAGQSEEARALHPLAHLLLEQVAERQRLDAAGQRLGQSLERSAQQLKEAQQLNAELQGKLDALAEIERSLPARPAAGAPPAPATDRNP